MTLNESQGHDVLVIGAGIAGLTAALAAKESGARVTLLEKAADCRDNNTSRAGGGFQFAPEMTGKGKRRYSAEEKAEEALRLSNGRCDSSLIKTFVEQAEDAFKWLEGRGFKWEEGEQSGGRRAAGGGAGICSQLVPIAEKMGCRLLFNARVTDILQKDRSWITAVKAITDDGEKTFTAGALVLATGGFHANSEMRTRYLGPEWAEVNLTGTPLGQGEGHLIAQRVGAQLVGMENFHSATIDTPKESSIARRDPLRALNLSSRLGIMVNKLGKRFIEENSTVNAIGASIRKQPQGEAVFIWDERIRQEVAQRTKKDEVEDYSRSRPGMISRVNSIEELAQLLGAPLEELKVTLENYNQALERGKGVELEVPRTSPGSPLNPPYYVIYPVKSALHSTLGGIKITPRAEVINQKGEAIPGLFAAGSVTGGFFCGQYSTGSEGGIFYQGNLQVTATSLACCTVFGRIAGREAALFALG